MDWIVYAPRIGEVFIKDSPADEVESEIHRLLREAGYRSDQIRLEGFTDQILGWIKTGKKFRRCISALPFDGPAIPGDDVYWLVEDFRPESSPSAEAFHHEHGVVLQVRHDCLIVQPDVGGPRRIKQSWIVKPPEAPADIEFTPHEQ